MSRLLAVLAALLVLPLAATAAEWSWREGEIDARGGYLVLFYGPEDADRDDWTPAARVGRPRGRVFPVEWLVDVASVENEALVKAVSADLDFYLKDVGRPDPWSYARYHCHTTSNLYGEVHWAVATP
jgi:hypothetical protein